MHAIDTNVLVRFLVADDKVQARKARAAIEASDVFVPMTVLLESEWVLRSGYGFAPAEVAEGLRGFAGLPGIMIEKPAQLAQALDWMIDGMDFADALHLSAAEECLTLLSFDKKFVKSAAGRSTVKVQVP